MRFDKWFKRGWVFNLSFLVLSSLSAAYYFAIGCFSLEPIIANPFDLLSHASVFPAPIVYLFFLPFFLSSYILLAMGVIEVYTSKKKLRSKIIWIFPMVVFGAIITVVYYFFGGRNNLTE